ncbi:phosphomannomutase/phosphoglucomutase [Brachybacterium alimentarium]|uniref:phosphomannomutase/phosphoglucomutase n=1 Tax=Brachybacterium alimentarium TaxID=47845 RepID=UPI000DF26F49|nr:phosphomannomutase/phosphoglucomutase [Brachybacterium alimentarium]RCS67938.1 phosphomannomutase/phosphoglucomutase [Brachybacterium alimentarium]RCS80945.1 phosphomannomutase/phosphoglucomutase [Brachybacterium alimentarium]
MTDLRSERPEAGGADLSRLVKAYDVRGIAGVELSVDVARALGAAFADFLEAPAVIVAHDMRVSSPELADAVIDGAVRRGAFVADAGLASTDQLYCASGLHRAAGVMVTASHNPPADNGLKLCLPGAAPISRDTGLDEIRRRAEAYLATGEIPTTGEGRVQVLDTLPDYAGTLHDLVTIPSERPLRLVVDAANAMAGHTAPAVLGRLDQLELLPLHFELDGTFPNHPADPLNRENLHDLQAAVVREGADLGLAFDGDADRCVVLDESGTLVPPSAITALIARREVARAQQAGQERPAVVANLVSSRHVAETVAAAGGELVRSPVGHSLIKAIMAEHDAVFGGEHSAHYYFRDFFFADSGMLAALHVLAALAETDGPLSALVAEHDPYPSSGEINSRVEDAVAARERVRAHVRELPGASTDDLDGLTVVHWDEGAAPEDRWWFSLRSSNTEPLLRLNVEAQRESTMIRIRDEILAIAQDEDLAPAVSVWTTDGEDPAHDGDDAPVEDETGGVDGEGLSAEGGAARADGTAPVVEKTATEDPRRLPAGASGADVPAWVRSLLRCPDCGGELRDVDAALQCDGCARCHPVQDGIPVLIAGR